MATRTKYGKDHHRRAFELYRELGSFYAVSREKGMPHRKTLLRWSMSDFDCACGFHGWDTLEKQIKDEVKIRDAQVNATDAQGPDLEKYILPDLKKLQINRMIEKKAFEAIKEEVAALPDTLVEAQKIIYAGWREDRVIRGEPGEITEIRGPLVIIRTERKDADGE